MIQGSTRIVIEPSELSGLSVERELKVKRNVLSLLSAWICKDIAVTFLVNHQGGELVVVDA